MRVILSLYFLLLLSYSHAQNVSDFITIWDLSISGSSPNSITFKTATTGMVNYSWQTIPAGSTGNGTFSGNSAVIGGLPMNAMIQLKIDSQHLKRFYIDTNADKSRLKEVKQWGKAKWSSMENAFSGCNNLKITATDVPDLSSVSSMKKMFAGASSMDDPIGNWNTSSVTDMSMLFKGATQFNRPLNNWNTSNVTNMMEMFKEATFFDQSLNNWNTAAVTNMRGMFAEAFAFNKPLSNWNTAAVTNMSEMFAGSLYFNQPIGNWNVSNVINMDLMFASADNFNQPLNTWNTNSLGSTSNMFLNNAAFNQPIHNWNMTNVNVMEGMFNGAMSFNQPLGSWMLNSSLLFMQGMFDNSGMDCANYSSTLDGWSQQSNVASGVTLGALGISYGTNVQTQRSFLVNTKNWTIVGDVAEPEDCEFFPVSNPNIEKAHLNITLYPNPCDKLSYIEYNVPDATTLSLRMLDITGKCLLNRIMPLSSGQHLIPIDLSEFSKGIYVLSLYDTNTKLHHRTQVLKY